MTDEFHRTPYDANADTGQLQREAQEQLYADDASAAIARIRKAANLPSSVRDSFIKAHLIGRETPASAKAWDNRAQDAAAWEREEQLAARELAIMTQGMPREHAPQTLPDWQDKPMTTERRLALSDSEFERYKQHMLAVSGNGGGGIPTAKPAAPAEPNTAGHRYDGAGNRIS